ncbi:MAG: 6-phosphogluconolactonase [Pseudomonadota bacterium]
MNLIEYPDTDLMMMDVADALAGALKSALLTHERVTFAVPGGSTPGPVFDILSAVHLDWDRVTILPSDERWVPPEHARANARLIRERLLKDAASAATFQPLYVAETEVDAALGPLAETVAPLLPLDVLMLGMGMDMHTASLFPGADGLADALGHDAPPVVATRPASQPEARVSLSGPVLQGALNTHVVMTGTGKRDVLQKASKLQPIEAPIQIVLTNATLHWAP